MSEFGEVRSIVHNRSGKLPYGWWKDEVLREYVLKNIQGLQWEICIPSADSGLWTLEVFVENMVVFSDFNWRRVANLVAARVNEGVFKYFTGMELFGVYKEVFDCRMKYVTGEISYDQMHKTIKRRPRLVLDVLESVPNLNTTTHHAANAFRYLDAITAIRESCGAIEGAAYQFHGYERSHLFATELVHYMAEEFFLEAIKDHIFDNKPLPWKNHD